MARVLKCQLSWKLSGLNQVIDHKLYGSRGDTVGYGSNFFDIANVAELYLPDILRDVTPYNKPITLGITAVDENGNESRRKTNRYSSVGEDDWVRHLLCFEVQKV